MRTICYPQSRAGPRFFSKIPSSVFTRTRCEFCPCLLVIISHNHYREIICMLVTCLSVHMSFKTVYKYLKRLEINCRWWKQFHRQVIYILT